jgi:tetratricopeptide (TPR) repeat protein
LNLFEDGTLTRNGELRLAKPLASLRIPPTVQGIIASRIDRLPTDDKDLLQTVAVIGTEFNLGVVRALLNKSDDELNHMLNDLQLAEFIYEQPAAGSVEYSFKHALTHDVAYNSLLSERRNLLHERTGQMIESLYPEQLEDHLSQLALHFDRSNNLAKAVEYLTRAGTQAAQQVAHSDAIGYFTRALESLRLLPAGRTRDGQELDLQMALNWSLYVTKGPRASPEREFALARARELCEQLGDNSRLMEALLALAQLRFNRHAFGAAQDLAERVAAMASETAIIAGAHTLLGVVGFSTGQFAPAREHFERAVELFGLGPSSSERPYLLAVAQVARHLLVSALGRLGLPVTARNRAHEFLADARRSADPISISGGLIGVLIHQLRFRDNRLVAERTDELFSIATAHEMVFELFVASFFRGWAMVAAGRIDEGISEMRRTISHPMFVETLANALFLVAVAEICSKHGLAEEGLDLVTDGLARVGRTGQKVEEAELHRLKGELLILKDRANVAEVEGCLRTAVDIARRQRARHSELRATVSLARLLRNTDRRDEAHPMLAEIYNWFTEGFDTPDLKDAKALLEELAA